MAIVPRKVLRLNLPRQGGDRPNYRIGGRVLAAIAPEPQGPEETVPVPITARDERPVDGGIVSRHALLEQLVAARSAIDRHSPEAIVTLGGTATLILRPSPISASAMATPGGTKGNIGGVKRNTGAVKRNIGAVKRNIGAVRRNVGDVKPNMRATTPRRN